MASEKAATQYQLEKEASRLREAQVHSSVLGILFPLKLAEPSMILLQQIEVERTRVSRRSLSSWEEDTDIKPFE